MIVGLLAGEFNPPHLGHLQMAKVALWSNKVDKVAFLPCWKESIKNKNIDFEHRANMCEILAQEDNRIETWWHQKDIQSLDLVNVLNRLYQLQPEAKNFRLILGADNYWKMEEWNHYEEIYKLAEPIWIDRPGYSRVPEESLVCNINHSSTKIREKIASQSRVLGWALQTEKKDPLLPELTLQLEQYIKTYHLYEDI